MLISKYQQNALVSNDFSNSQISFLNRKMLMFIRYSIARDMSFSIYLLFLFNNLMEILMIHFWLTLEIEWQLDQLKLEKKRY